ncbi:hypothetical protein CPC08DRAFT_515382 [Agrocybe pediades]|nr:hypothetical protein CPC08DRAFT_515382 [Agrocybe pediades]
MSNTAIILFDISSVAGLVLLTAVFLTAWGSSGAARTPTWFTFIGSLIVLSGTNILIMGEQTGPEPTKWACFLQAIFIYPEVVFNAHAGAALLVQVYLSMLSIERSRILPRKYVTWLVVCPVASTFAILVLSTVLQDGSHQSICSQTRHLRNAMPSRTSPPNCILHLGCGRNPRSRDYFCLRSPGHF